jgi:Tfp pilus assembly PilM family ATPase
MRRVLAIDAGARKIKLLLAETDFGRLNILKTQSVDVVSEGLTTPEESKAYFKALLEDWGSPPIALVLPQHLSTSHIIDLPEAPEAEVDKLIADEAIKLGGVSESRIIYDFVPAHPGSNGRQQFWVTLAQEGDIRERLSRLGIEDEQVCEVTTTANALISASRAIQSPPERMILVHVGAQTTVVVIVVSGQGAFATSFQMGGDFFTRALARQLQCPEEQAETIRNSRDLFAGPDAAPEFINSIEGWITEFDQQLKDWFRLNVAGPNKTEGLRVLAGGGAFSQPGLLDYLKRRTGLEIQPWPETGNPSAPAGFEVAFGGALHALGLSGPTPSLLPEDYRAAWRKQLSQQRLELASVGMALIILVILGFGIWGKLKLIESKQHLLAKIVSGQELVESDHGLRTELVTGYNTLRPVFVHEQHTVDTLRTLALLQQSRSNKAYWYVLVADQLSYFSYPSATASTNKPAKTNAPAGPDPLRINADAATLTAYVPGTNASPPRLGFIAELTIPEDADSARKSLRELVGQLDKQPIFSRVDLLSDDLRRSLAEPKVLIPDRHFALELDLARSEFLQPLQRLAPLPTPVRNSRSSLKKVPFGPPAPQEPKGGKQP